MIDRLLDLPFLRLPPGLSPADGKLLRMRTALPAIGAVMHVVQLVLFPLIGLERLAVLSGVSVLWFSGTILLIRRGHARLGVWLAYGEVALHMPLLAVCLGPDAGYFMYAFCLATVPFVATTPDQAFDRWFLVGYAAIMGPALYAWGQVHPPLIEMAPWVLSGLFYMNVAGVTFALVATTAWFARAAAAAEAESERERARSEQLLRNILPEPVARRLKDGEDAIADHFEGVSVLFADIVGFTPLSARLSTPEIIGILNRVFSDFDALADRHGLEKIKTIGDAYMVVGGLPEAMDDHAGAMASMALDMRDAVRAFAAASEVPIDIRIGVHSGPVVAGVIGRRKFAYDLWGDTVNIASRMESHGEPGAIQISDETRSLLGDRFALRERGPIEVKGRGAMRTWWLDEAARARGAQAG